MDFYPTSLYLASRTGPGRAGDITAGKSVCCDSKELEINLSYNNFFYDPRPTTRINQISSFHANVLSLFLSLSHARATCIFLPLPTYFSSFLAFFFPIIVFRSIRSRVETSCLPQPVRPPMHHRALPLTVFSTPAGTSLSRGPATRSTATLRIQ